MLSKPEFLANQSQREGSFNAPFIEVRNLYAAYGDNVVVRNLSLSVGAGEHLSLLGPSGCGKSTTAALHCRPGEPIAARSSSMARRCSRPSATDQYSTAEAQSVAMVFQSYAIWPHMTVFENVAYGLRVQAYRRRRGAAGASTERSTMVGMEDFIDRPATDLSGGQQQRVALARSYAPSPEGDPAGRATVQSRRPAARANMRE